MKIGILGSGAMGSIYGGILSKNNDVHIIARNQKVIDIVKEKGIKIDHYGETDTFYPNITNNISEVGEVELLILFVKSLVSREVLNQNKELIGPNTRIMTLQNGAGHENLLEEFVPQKNIIIGTTEDNGSIVEYGHVSRGGTGTTNIGMVVEDDEQFLPKVKEAFDICGFEVKIHDNIQRLIWDKLFINTSLSVVTAILQVDMGYIAKNKYAWNLTKGLIDEAIKVAESKGLNFNEDYVVEKVKQTSLNNPEGCTSLRADLRDGRKTEVDNISGAVIREARNNNINVPLHEFAVNFIHASEEKEQK